MQIDVYGLRCKFIGTAQSFGEAKQMQQDALPDDLKDHYAGIQDGMPLFYSETLTPALVEKYGLPNE